MRTLAQLAIALAVLAFGLYQAFAPTFDSGFARMQADPGDTVLNHLLLENSWRSVSDSSYRGTLFSPPFFYPQRGVIWLSEHLFGVAPVYWALRLALPDDLAYQWWQILLSTLNFVAFALVARRLGIAFVPALLGAYLWAFALVHIDQLRHQQLIPRFWMPVAVYYAWSFAQVPSLRALNRMLACAFLQSAICMNVGWFLIGGLAAFLPAAIGVRPGGPADVRGFVARERVRVAGIVLGWTAVFAAAFIPYVIVNWGMSRAYRECEGYLPTPSAWLTGPPGSHWQTATAPFRRPVQEECVLFCGFAFLALAAIAFAHLTRAIRRPDAPTAFRFAFAAFVAALAWVVLTLSPGQIWANHAEPSLWRFVREIPGGRAIRCICRVYTTVYLFATLGAMAWLSAVTQPLRPLRRTALHTALAIVVIVEQTGYAPPSFDKTEWNATVDGIADQLHGADAGYVDTHQTDATGVYRSAFGEVQAMWAGLRANVPVVNGYSGRWMAGSYPGAPIPTDEDLRVWLAGRFHGTLAIVVPGHPERRRTITIE